MKMRFGMLSRVDQRNHVLDGVQIPMGRGNFEGERHAPTCPTTLEIPFHHGLGWAQESMYLMGSRSPCEEVFFRGKDVLGYARRCSTVSYTNKNSSGDEIANVNFFYNIAHVEASAYAH